MKAETLKKSILQYAMQGKLVEQNPNDEPASELLKRIKAEKEQLIKEGKIKKEKPLPPITEDEKPFELPQGWEWVRLGDICDLYTGNSISETIKQLKYANISDGYDYIGTKDVLFSHIINYENGVKIPYDEPNFKHSYPNSILLCIEGGSAGRKIALVDKKVCFGNKLCSFNSIILNFKYLYYFMQSPIFTNIFIDNKSGIIGGVSIKKIKELFCVLPPLAEQQRIVEKLEQILPLIEEYCKNEEKLSELNKTLPDKIKQSILQYAVQGKLVPQNPNDEPASELLKRIKAEKEQLIKEGKIKKEKPLPPITEDEKPFELPQGWEWVRLGEILNIARGGSPRPIQDYLTTESDGLNWIKIGDSDKGSKYINLTKEKITKLGLSKTRYVHKGDFLLSNSMSFGRPYILNIDGCIHDGWLVLVNIEKCFSKDFLYYLLSSFYIFQQFCGKVSGAVVKNLNTNKVAEAIVCVPPLAEQQRIVEKVEELMSIINTLK